MRIWIFLLLLAPVLFAGQPARDGITLWSLPIPASGALSLALSPDGARLAVAGPGHPLELRDTGDGHALGQVLTNFQHGDHVCWSPDGKLLAEILADGRQVLIREAGTGTRVQTLETWDALRGAAFSRDGGKLALAGTHGAVRIYAPAQGELLADLEGGTGGAGWGTLAFSPDGKRLAVSEGEAATGNLALWDVARKTLLDRLPVQGRPGALAFNADGSMLACVGGNRIWLFGGVGARALGSLQGQRAPVTTLAFSPDGRTLVSAGGGDLAVWDPTARTLVRTWFLDAEALGSLQFSPDGRHLVLASWSPGGEDRGTARLVVLDAARLKEHPDPLPRTLPGGDKVLSLAWSPDGGTLYRATSKRVEALSEGREPVPFPLPEGTVIAGWLAPSPDGRQLVGQAGKPAFSRFNRMVRWEVGTHALVGPESFGHWPAFEATGALWYFQLDPNLSFMRRQDAQGSVRPGALFDKDGHTQKGSPLEWIAEGPPALDPKGRFIAGGHPPKLLDPFTGRPVHRLYDPAPPETLGTPAFAFSPEGDWVAGAYGSTFRTWSLETLETLPAPRKLSDPAGFWAFPALGPGGRLLALVRSKPNARGQDAVYLAEPATGSLVACLASDLDVSALALSRDGRRLAVGCGTGATLLWDLAPLLDRLGPPPPPPRPWGPVCLRMEEPIFELALSPEGDRIAWRTDKDVQIRSAEGLQLLRTFTFEFQGVENTVRHFALSPDWTRMVAATQLGGEKVWDLATGKALGPLEGSRDGRTDETFSPDGRHLFAQNQSGATLSWKVPEGPEPPRFEGAGDPPSDQDGKKGAYTYLQTLPPQLYWRPARTSRPIFPNTPYACALPGGWAFFGPMGLEVTGPELAVVERARFPGQNGTALAASRDGAKLAVAFRDRIELWRTRPLSLLRVLDAPSPPRRLLFTRDGSELISAHDDLWLRRWPTAD